jgi:glycosyltransferase involved in cell wall biosynthesis
VLEVLHQPAYLAGAGHGGNRRSAQIAELFHRHGVSAITAPQPPVPERLLERIRYAAIGALPSSELPSARLLSPKGLSRAGYHRSAVKQQLAQIERATTLVWETVYGYGGNYLLGAAARRRRKRVVALPHNIESLVPRQRCWYVPAAKWSWLRWELGWLRAADAVFCISREDQWLLGLMGFSAHYLPYYPTEEVQTWLLEVRNARRAAPAKDTILLLGTAGNPPTFEGMRAALVALGERSSKLDGFRIAVVGRGVAKLRESVPGTQFDLYESASNEQLRSVLIRARCCVAHQIPTSGVLTRIVEMQIAGVPVVANWVSARSHLEQDGVTVYDELDELVDLVMHEFSAPAVPRRNARYEARFIRALSA